MQKLNRQTAPNTKKHTTRVLQFGEGNFLRAFTDWMVHIMNKEANFDAGIDVVQPLATGMVDMLNSQDGLYHVYLKGIKNGKPVTEFTLVDCVNRGINPYVDFDIYKSAILNPDLRFVISNTTEAGICMEASDTIEMKPQQSFPAKVAALLFERFRFFEGDKNKGLIFFACELIDRNGDMLRKFVLQHAQNWNLGVDF
ncbi:MAG TPA: tagaturonate reductase, partial [Prolixibacteraceae bacterium]|nr:tagaturonate reductase [Prolixibacteraceae bacterium]